MGALKVVVERVFRQGVRCVIGVVIPKPLPPPVCRISGLNCMPSWNNCCWFSLLIPVGEGRAGQGRAGVGVIKGRVGERDRVRAKKTKEVEGRVRAG